MQPPRVLSLLAAHTSVSLCSIYRANLMENPEDRYHQASAQDGALISGSSPLLASFEYSSDDENVSSLSQKI